MKYKSLLRPENIRNIIWNVLKGKTSYISSGMIGYHTNWLNVETVALTLTFSNNKSSKWDGLLFQLIYCHLPEWIWFWYYLIAPGIWCSNINSLAPGRPRCYFKTAIFNLLLLIGIFTSSKDNALRWIPRDLTDDKSTLVQIMAWCRQAPSHYLSQCWPSSMSPYGIIRPQWVNVIREHMLYEIALRQMPQAINWAIVVPVYVTIYDHHSCVPNSRTYQNKWTSGGNCRKSNSRTPVLHFIYCNK